MAMHCHLTEDFQIFAMQSEKRDLLRHLPPFHVPRAASDVEDHVFRFALYGIAKIWKSSVTVYGVAAAYHDVRSILVLSCPAATLHRH